MRTSFLCHNFEQQTWPRLPLSVCGANLLTKSFYFGEKICESATCHRRVVFNQIVFTRLGRLACPPFTIFFSSSVEWYSLSHDFSRQVSNSLIQIQLQKVLLALEIYFSPEKATLIYLTVLQKWPILFEQQVIFFSFLKPHSHPDGIYCGHQ